MLSLGIKGDDVNFLADCFVVLAKGKSERLTPMFREDAPQLSAKTKLMEDSVFSVLFAVEILTCVG